MISRISGKLVESNLTQVVVDVHGVGYALDIPVSTYEKLPRIDADVSLHTHLNVRDDAMQLFGFATPEERQLFRLLVTVSGIGPRLALNVLSCMSTRSFCETVVAADIKALSRVNGIGKRSAERLIVELRERVKEIEPAAAFAQENAGGILSAEAQDAITALATLGFKAEAARKTVEKLCRELPSKEHSAQNLIRRALGSLNP